MVKYITLFAVLFCCVLPKVYAVGSEDPAVCFYSEENYLGEEFCFSPEEHQGQPVVWNRNSYNSAKITQGYEITFHRSYFYMDDYPRTYSEDVPSIWKLGSWEISKYARLDDRVCFFSRFNFQGKRFCFSDSFNGSSWNLWKILNQDESFIWNNRAASVSLPENSKAILFTEMDFVGQELVVEEDLGNLPASHLYQVSSALANENISITAFYAEPDQILIGETSNLNWQITGANAVNIEPQIGDVQSTGSFLINPTQTTTYLLTAENYLDQLTQSVTVVVNERLRANITANPQSGNPPLRVTFLPMVESEYSIQRYYWDLNGDGIFETNSPLGDQRVYTYTTPGEYIARLRVVDSNGDEDIATKTISVLNEAPHVSVSADPTNGEAPLTVTFTVDATDADGISLIEVDYDGDGVFDHFASSPPNPYYITTVYQDPGVYSPAVRVQDNSSQTTTVSNLAMEIRGGLPGDPSVNLVVNNDSGTAPLSTAFTAVASLSGDAVVSSYLWDFDGDLVIDKTTTTTALSVSESYVYDQSGIFYPSVAIVTADGKLARDIEEVEVLTSASLARSRDSIDTTLSEVVNITTTLSGGTVITLDIKNSNDQIIKTLVKDQFRNAGDHVDTWDGTGEEGNTVAQGEYYAVLHYQSGDQIKTLDLRQSTGGSRSNPPRSRLPSTFYPYEEPLKIDFTLSRASQVTAFMGLFNQNVRLVTFLERAPLEAGQHTIYWHGEAENGQPINPGGDRFLFGIWAYTMSANAIFVKNAPMITNLAAEPQIFNPVASRTRINFGVDQEVTKVEVKIDSQETGAIVKRATLSGFDVGQNSIIWEGNNDAGLMVPSGSYRIGLTAFNENGSRSYERYTLVRVSH